jgi:RES domain-containing protein
MQFQFARRFFILARETASRRSIDDERPHGHRWHEHCGRYGLPHAPGKHHASHHALTVHGLPRPTPIIGPMASHSIHDACFATSARRGGRRFTMSARHNPVDDALDASFPASDPPSHASPLAAVPLDATTDIPATLALYRIVEGHRKGTSLAKMIGRTEHHWASPEMGLIRMATSIPLAILDYLVELEGRTPHAHVLVTVRIPCSAVSILNEYPTGWDQVPCGRDVRAAGDAWTAEARCLGLRVPSVTCAGEGNVLLNPAHPTAGCIDSFTMSAFRLDPRLRT